MFPMAHWVGRQCSEALGTGSNPSLYLYVFNFLYMISNYEDCFFSTPIKISFFRKFLLGTSWIKKFTFVGILFSYQYYSFQDHNELFSLFLIVFPGILFSSMLVQFMSSTPKSSCTKTFGTVGQKNSKDNRDMHIFFLDTKKIRIAKSQISPKNFFGAVRQTFFDKKSWYSSSPLPRYA